MNLDQTTADVQALAEVENAELTDVGVSVKFTECVDTYLDGVKILRETIDDTEVSHFSNMTGEGDNQIIILVEF